MSKRNALCVLIAIAGLAMQASYCFGEQPACTGDRHYDGVACCLTTSTTLPGDCTCPDHAPCPEVKCEGGDSTYNVTVNRCPETRYIDHIDRCHYSRKSHKVVCPNKDFPRRLLVPSYEGN